MIVISELLCSTIDVSRLSGLYWRERRLMKVTSALVLSKLSNAITATSPQPVGRCKMTMKGLIVMQWQNKNETCFQFISSKKIEHR